MRFLTVLGMVLFLAAPVQADPLREAIGDYLEFATAGEGVILPEQLTPDLLAQITFVDTRSSDAFAADGIAGALHMEWRDIAARLEDVPETGMVVMYCDTGALSAQAMFAARLMGRSNVLVLQGGLTAWHAR
jgi:rhodanese-related sulfurtransferase